MGTGIRIFPPLRRIKFYLFLLFVAVTIKVPWVLIMQEDGEALLQDDSRDDVLARRLYLINKVIGENLTNTDMPVYLPSQFRGEWAVGTYSMMAVALANIAFRYPETQPESLLLVRALIERMLLPETRQFDQERWGEDPLSSLDGNNGHIGYLGHLNWMISAYRFMGGDDQFDDLFKSISQALHRRLRDSPGYCLRTYPVENLYVPDNVVVVASLNNYARLQDAWYENDSVDWVSYARAHWLDSKSELLSFYLDESCQPVGKPRGSGLGWNSFYLPFIDKAFADHQFERMREHYLQQRIFTGLREYPTGVFGFGDVDSGPVLFGFSPSGTGFAVAGAVHAKDSVLLGKLLLTSEAVGSSIRWGDEKFYLFAPIVGEAIMLAMKTAIMWDTRFVIQ